LTALVMALASGAVTVQAQRMSRANERNVQVLINRIERRTADFRVSLDASLDRSRVDGTRREDNINQFVLDFQSAVSNLRERFNQRQAVAADVQDVLNRAATINDFLLRTRGTARVQTDWAGLRQDLDELSRIYGVSWNWNTTTQTYPSTSTYPRGGRGGAYAANRLTGTFRLDPSRSDDARDMADRATRSLPYRDRQRVLDSLTARLESPDQIAIDRRGRTITIASTRAPQITFEADGRETVERMPSGRDVRVRATLLGDQLSVSTAGNRESDFTVTFDPIDNGQRLRVTRRISNANLTTPVTVQSVYERTADVARFDIYNGTTTYPNSNYPNNNYPDSTTASGDFVIPNGTLLVAMLNENLSATNSQENDRFTMTVREPSQYDGAVIEGYVSNVSRGGRITGRSEMTLNYERIRLRDGRTYRFAGLTESLRTNGGETVRVDNEGSVAGSNQTNKTAQRAAIGTAVGAIIGAIAGGGKGAAIGAVVGAGAGAGSVYVQGNGNLELPSGTEVSIRATGPR
jgi:hypothetical protein